MKQDKAQEEKDLDCLESLRATLQKLRKAKPEERNELARRYAVTITEMEKVLGYYYTFVIMEEVA